MKNPLNLLASFLLLTTILSGCTADSPSPPPSGDARDTYVGTWSVNETELKLSYEVSIEIDTSSSSRVNIYNFANSGTAVPAVAVVSGNTITLVSDQVIGDGWVINGGGALAGSSKITWAYTLNDGANLHNLSAVYSKL
jgi:hypothetical protein